MVMALKKLSGELCMHACMCGIVMKYDTCLADINISSS